MTWRSHPLRPWSVAALTMAMVVSACWTRSAPGPVEASHAEVVDEPVAEPATRPVRRRAVLDEAPRAPMGRFFRALDHMLESEIGPGVGLLMLGDSHTASDTLSGPLRRHLVEAWGDAGRGYSYPGTPWRHYRQVDMTTSQSGPWEVMHVARQAFEPPVGLAGLRMTSREPGARVTRGLCAPPCAADTYTLHYLLQEGGGTLSLYLGASHEATLWTGLDPEDPSRRLGRHALPIPPPGGDRTLSVVVEGDGLVTLLGIAADAVGPGVRLDSLGLNGAQIIHFLRSDPALMEEEVMARQPRLLLLAFGTNEAFSSRYGPNVAPEAPLSLSDDGPMSHPASPEAHPTLIADLDALVTRLRRGAPDADCLVLLPPDLVPSRDNPPCRERVLEGWPRPVCWAASPWRFEVVHASLRQAAVQAGCAIWDQRHAMGGPGSMRAWMAADPPLAAPDGVHLSQRGYRALADALAADLLDAWARYREGGDFTLQTSQPFGPLRDVLTVGWDPDPHAF